MFFELASSNPNFTNEHVCEPIFFIPFLIQFFNHLDFGLLQVYQDQGEKVEFSGPLLSQSHKVDELLERHERHIRQAVRRSWFQRGTDISFGSAFVV